MLNETGDMLASCNKKGERGGISLAYSIWFILVVIKFNFIVFIGRKIICNLYH